MAVREPTPDYQLREPTLVDATLRLGSGEHSGLAHISKLNELINLNHHLLYTFLTFFLCFCT